MAAISLVKDAEGYFSLGAISYYFDQLVKILDLSLRV